MRPDITLAIGLAFIANALWYAAKVVLRRKGYPVQWFYAHITDFPNMVRLVRATPVGAERTRYVTLLVALSVAVAAFVFAAIRTFTVHGAA